MLPESAEAANMLQPWRAAETRYWGGRLRSLLAHGRHGAALVAINSGARLAQL